MRPRIGSSMRHVASLTSTTLMDHFQSGNMLSLIISKQDEELIEGLKAGMELADIQFYSPIAIFNGAGIVASKTQIKSGPKQGDHCLDIRIKSS